METERQATGMQLITGEAAQRNVRPGDCVEVDFVIDEVSGKRERVWVAVESVQAATIEGILLNGPFFTDGMLGDEISGVPVRDVLTILRVHNRS